MKAERQVFVLFSLKRNMLTDLQGANAYTIIRLRWCSGPATSIGAVEADLTAETDFYDTYRKKYACTMYYSSKFMSYDNIQFFSYF